MFMANYADVLTDAPLPDMIDRFSSSNAVASLLAVPPQSSHHAVDIADNGMITSVTPMRDLRHWENGDTSCFDLRSSTSSTRTRIWSRMRSSVWSVGARDGLPVQGLLVSGRHREGASTAR